MAVFWDVTSQVTLQDQVAAAAFVLSEACGGSFGVEQDDDEDFDTSEGE